MTNKIDVLVTTEWLAAHLGDPGIRIVDASAELLSQPVGLSKVVSGRAQWRERRIPGSVYASMVDGFAQPGQERPYAFPDKDTVANTLRRIGVNSGSRVILYGSGRHTPVTRVWWILRCYGLDNVAILDGGFDKWLREGRPLEHGDAKSVRASDGTAIEFRSSLIADQSQVSAALGCKDVCLLNALLPEQFEGRGGGHFGRPGRIPWSVNVSARDLVDLHDGTFLPQNELRRKFAVVGALAAPKVIAYCGGGVAATTAAFALTLLGHPDVSVYDGSLAEWSNKPELPMVSGAPGPWG